MYAKPTMVGASLLAAAIGAWLSPALAQDAAWLTNPGSANYSAGANWSTGSVPTGTASFGASNTTTLTGAGGSIGGWTFNSGASNYTIDIGNLSFTGAGIVSNGGGVTVNVNNISEFENTSSAGSAAININNLLVFADSSTAGNAAITNNNALVFEGNGTATAGNSTIINQGVMQFDAGGTAGNATITTISGAGTFFEDTGGGGTARLIMNGTGFVDLSLLTTGGMTAGSIEGDGGVFLGANNLSVGGNNLSTTFSGMIQDGAEAGGGGTGGSLTKTGTGTLALDGTSTYTGGTTILGGTLVANHNDGSGTVPGTGAIDALGSGAITLSGGSLRTGISGWLANDITFAAGTTSTLSAATGTTLSLGGDSGTPGDTSTSSTGNLPSHLFLGANAVAQFGSATDTGIIQIGMTSINNLPNVDPTARIVVAGGTLQDLQSSLWEITSAAASTTVNAGATLDFNDASLQIVNNLLGAGTVKTGVSASVLLSLVVDAGATDIFSGRITGAGSVELDSLGVGTIVFAGNNDYTGTTTICGCTTLQLGNGGTSGAISSNVLDGGTLAFNRSGTYVFGFAIDDLPGFQGQVVQMGPGTTILTALNSYTGNTIVAGGTLEVDGSIASSAQTTVNSGAVLAGAGAVGVTQILSGGTLAPGGATLPTGTLSVSGSLAFQSGAIYLVTLRGANSSSTIVAGAATIVSGAVANVAAGSTPAGGTTYTILTASGGVNGTFANASVFAGAYQYMLSYDAKDVYLTAKFNSLISLLPAMAPTNVRNVANAIDNAILGGVVPPLSFQALFNLPPAQLQAALTRLSGETATGAQQTTFNAMTQFMGLMTDPFTAGRGFARPGATGFADTDPYASTGDSRAARDAYAMFTKAPLAKLYDPHWSVWASGFGGSQTTDGNAAVGSNTTTSSIGGVAAGADYLISPQTIAGFALSGGGTSFSVANGGGGRSDLFQAGAFVRHTAGSAYATAALAYGWQDITTDRSATAVGTGQLHANFDANAWSARIEGGNRYPVPWFGGIGLTPYAAAQFTAFDLPAYAETDISGSGFALAYAAKTANDTRSELGLRTDKFFAVDDAILTLRGRAAWAHDYDTDRSIAATFQSLVPTSFVVNGASPAHDSALTTASAEMKFSTGISLAATFEGEFSDLTRSYAGKGVVRYDW